MEWLLENFWVLFAGIWAATLVWYYTRNTRSAKEKYGEDGTHHCPHCGNIVGETKDDKTDMSTFLVPESGEEDDLPDNVLPFNRRVRPVFNEDDGPKSA